jgi:hypothetical protein
MAIDPALQPTYPVQTPPIVAPRTQGMVISLMNIAQMRYMAFEPFSPANSTIPCGVVVTGTTDAMGKTIVTQPTAPGSNLLGVTLWNQQRFLNWNAANGYFEYQANDLVSLLEEGDVIMYSEVAVDVGQPVYNRIAVNGALTRIGALSNAAGTGLELVPRARFLEKSAPGLVRLHVDF